MPTRKHTSHGERLIALLLVLAAQSQAQFTNVWPTWEHPRSGRDHAWQVYSSVHERVSVVTTAKIYRVVAPAWYRSQRDNLVAWKRSVRWVIPYYISHTNDSASHSAWLNTQTNGQYSQWNPGPMPALTATQLLASLRMPTNYFDYTPYRCLDGIGPLTNDASVGRPHGWDVTASGGTNFPEGRTNWYTSDYGWEGMRVIITNLVKRSVIVGGSPYTHAVSGESSESEADALANAMADYNSGEAEPASPYGQVGYYTARYASGEPPSYWLFLIVNGSIVYDYTPQIVWSNFTPTCYGWARTLNVFPGALSASDDYVYAQQNLGYSTVGSWYQSTNVSMVYGWQSLGCENKTNGVRFEIGSTNSLPDMSPSADFTPHGHLYMEGDYYGHKDRYEGVLMMDYSAESGFKYK